MSTFTCSPRPGNECDGESSDVEDEKEAEENISDEGELCNFVGLFFKAIFKF